MQNDRTKLIDWKVPARIGRLTELLEARLATSIVADTLSREWGVPITRNMVIGAAGRNDLTLNAVNPTYNKGYRKIKPQTSGQGLSTQVIKAYQRAVGNGSAAKVDIVQPVYSQELASFNKLIPTAQRKQLVDIEFGRHCRWPVGDPQAKDFFYCGGATETTYCAYHASVAVDKTRRPMKDRGFIYGRRS